MALVRGHAFGTETITEKATHEQQCGSCEGVRRVENGHVQWLDRDGTVLPQNLRDHLEGSCPGPIEQATLREHYRA